jgi:hypothetical protein
VAQGCSVTKDMKLPVWFKPDQIAWPPPPISIPIPAAYLLPFDPEKAGEARKAQEREAHAQVRAQNEKCRQEEEQRYNAAQRRGRYGS